MGEQFLQQGAVVFVANDVAGIDLNCGCPQPFSIQGGMGAYLLSHPCTIIEIISSLRSSLPSHVTVSCKIRLLNDSKSTINLINKLNLNQKVVFEIVDLVLLLIQDSEKYIKCNNSRVKFNNITNNSNNSLLMKSKYLTEINKITDRVSSPKSQGSLSRIHHR